jgi:hypothetical protein
MALAVACAVASHYGAPIYVVAVLALVAGSAKETAPIFAALFAWSPWPLVGLLAPLAALRIIADGPDVLDAHNAWILEHPLRASWKFHKGHLLDGAKFLAPWGGAVAGFAHLDWQLAAVLAAAYGQVVVATDTVRLYQWAAPVMCVAAATAVPTAWLPLLVLATIWNPLAGDGI